MSRPGQAYLVSPYRPGTGVMFTNPLDSIVAAFDCVPNQVTVFDPQTPSIQTTYAITGSIGGTRLRIGGAVVGTDQPYPAGSPLSFLLVPSSSGLTLTTTGTSGAATLVGSTLNVPDYATGGGSGTVTTTSIVSANGFAGTVATATTTPAITLSTTVTGLLKGDGTAISAAVADTDYQRPIALTTTGSSGAATLVGDTLNIPQYSGGSSIVLTTTGTGGAATLVGGTLNIPVYAAGSGTVTSVSVASANGLAGTVATATTTPAITLSTTVTGLLKGNGTAISAAVANTDYQGPIILTTTGSSGASTLVGDTLNIPQYAAGSGTVTTTSIVSANGFAGTVANPTTTPAITLSTTVTGILKGNGTGVSAAVANTDYQGPIALTTTGTSGASTLVGDTLNIPQYAAGSGTVTSVAMTTPSWLTVGGSPVTTSGTLAVTTTTGLAGNTFLATPNGSAGTVALRAIAAADLPTTGLVLAESTKPTASTTYGATTTFDFSTNDNRKATLAGNTIVAFSNVSVDQRFSAALTQDATGSRLVTSWPAGVTWANGAPPVLTTTAGATDLFLFWCTATNTYLGYTTAGAAAGTVTSVSVASANGLAGSVATATTTPAITLSTTVTGLLKGNGTAISAAVANTDYQGALTLTTTGTSGASTLVGSTLNVPNYAGGGGTPGGSSGQVQYDNAGAFGGAAGALIGSAGQLNLPATTVASPASFDIWTPTSNRGGPWIQRDQGPSSLLGTFFKCGACTAVTAASQASLFGSPAGVLNGQSLTIPANSLAAGNRLWFKLTGKYTSVGTTNTGTLQVYLGSSMVLTNTVSGGTVFTVAQSTARPIMTQWGYLEILAIGSSATCSGTVALVGANPGGGSLAIQCYTGSTAATFSETSTFNSTIAQALDFKWTWSTTGLSIQVLAFEAGVAN